MLELLMITEQPQALVQDSFLLFTSALEQLTNPHYIPEYKHT
jgi:hypothetical protein